MILEQTGQDSDPASGRWSGELWQLPRHRRGGFELSMAFEKCDDDLLTLLRFERADRKDQSAARLQPLGGRFEQLALNLRALGDDGRARPIQHLGMAAERASRRAGRVEQDGV